VIHFNGASMALLRMEAGKKILYPLGVALVIMSRIVIKPLLHRVRFAT